jgi:WD40 repeat protein
VAVGSNAGTLTIYFLTDFMEKGGNFYRVDEVAFRKDCKSECTEVKFSPSNEKIVLGAHDDSIYVYGCELTLTPTGQGRNTNTLGSCVLRALHRLRGHSSAITHIDWSYDSKLLRSTCQAYELLCWDVETGKLSPQTNVADVRWKTHHCVLGFHVMGIWPLYSDGTDINAIDVSNEKGVVVTANDDGGLVRLFNYPCVVKNAPVKEYAGHSSHVTNIKFLRGGDTVVTSGGNDGSAMVFDVVRDTADDNGFR